MRTVKNRSSLFGREGPIDRKLIFNIADAGGRPRMTFEVLVLRPGLNGAFQNHFGSADRHINRGGDRAVTAGKLWPKRVGVTLAFRMLSDWQRKTRRVVQSSGCSFESVSQAGIWWFHVMTFLLTVIGFVSGLGDRAALHESPATAEAGNQGTLSPALPHDARRFSARAGSRSNS